MWARSLSPRASRSPPIRSLALILYFIRPPVLLFEQSQSITDDNNRNDEERRGNSCLSELYFINLGHAHVMAMHTTQKSENAAEHTPLSCRRMEIYICGHPMNTGTALFVFKGRARVCSRRY